MRKLVLTTCFMIAGAQIISAAGFSGVHGDDGNYNESKYFEALNDNDISAGTGNGWSFKSASISGPDEKSVKINDGKDGLSTYTQDGKNFNYVSFSIAVSGDLTKPSDKKGSLPSYNLSASRNQAKYFPVFGGTNSVETNPGFLSTIKAYVPVMTTPPSICSMEMMLTGENGTNSTYGGKLSDWSISPKKYNPLVGGELIFSMLNYRNVSTCQPFPIAPSVGQYTLTAKPTQATEDNTSLTALITVISGEWEASGKLSIDNYTNSMQHGNSSAYCSNIYFAIDTTKACGVHPNIEGMSQEYWAVKINDKATSQKENITIPAGKSETKLEISLAPLKNAKPGETIVEGPAGVATLVPLPAKRIGVVRIRVNGAELSPLDTEVFRQANISVTTKIDNYSYPNVPSTLYNLICRLCVLYYCIQTKPGGMQCQRIV